MTARIRAFSPFILLVQALLPGRAAFLRGRTGLGLLLTVLHLAGLASLSLLPLVSAVHPLKMLLAWFIWQAVLVFSDSSPDESTAPASTSVRRLCAGLSLAGWAVVLLFLFNHVKLVWVDSSRLWPGAPESALVLTTPLPPGASLPGELIVFLGEEEAPHIGRVAMGPDSTATAQGLRLFTPNLSWEQTTASSIHHLYVDDSPLVERFGDRLQLIFASSPTLPPKSSARLETRKGELLVLPQERHFPGWTDALVLPEGSVIGRLHWVVWGGPLPTQGMGPFRVSGDSN